MFGFGDLQEHVHKLENSLDSCRDDMDEERVDYYLRGIDTVREYFKSGSISFKENVAKEEIAFDIEVKRKEVEKRFQAEIDTLYNNQFAFVFTTYSSCLTADL